MKPLKPNELRLGNRIQVESLTDGSTTEIECNLFHLSEMGKSIKYQYFGIPLTEDWLVRFGFEKSEIVDGRYRKGCVDLDYDECFYYEISESAVDVYSVHELQNLWFIIYGTELNLKP